MTSTRRAHVPLSRDRILDVAMDLVATDGLSALSMRRLATELDTGAMSLYNHVPDKDALLDGLADRVLDEVTLPDASVPRDLVWHWATSLRRTILEHRALVPVIVSSRRTGGLQAVGILLYQGLVEAGVEGAPARRIVQVAGRFVAGSVMFDGAGERRGAVARELDETFQVGLAVILDGFGLGADPC